MPISNGKVTDKFGLSIMNNYNIVGQLLSDCMNLDEFDQSRYDNRLYDDFKIGKKKQKLNIEPTVNLVSTKSTYSDRSNKDSNYDSYKAL